jgi:leader peptidase (prepilin peptidase)/N-methyltransferase
MVGSFLNVCIVRLPKGESLVSLPSHCPGCKRPVRFYDNVPLLSYIFLLGRCRSCGMKISPRYFAVEFLMAALSVALLQHLGLGVAYFTYFAFAASMIVITFVDLDYRIVPDVISLPGIVLGLALSVIVYLLPIGYNSALPSPPSSFFGILIGGGILLLVAWAYHFFTGVEGMGEGDVKLLAMIGAFLGWMSIPVTLFFASFTGSVLGLVFILIKGGNGKYALPFAPFLCLGALFHLFFGNDLIDLYLSFGMK